MGVDLRDWFRGALSTRWLLWHVAELGDTSRVHREMEHRDLGDASLWSTEAHLLANVQEMVRQGNYLQECWLWANADPDKRPKDPPAPPEPMRRPGHVEEKPKEDQPAPKFASAAELMSMFNQK